MKLLGTEKMQRRKKSDVSDALKRGRGMPRRYLWGAAVSLCLAGCTIPQVRISSLPAQIERIEGYASLRIKTEQDSVRSKFSFLFLLPRRGRIDVSNFLGRTLYQILVDEQTAFLIIPSKKVYWKGDEEQIVERFLGFRLNFDELLSLMTGQWDESEEKDWRRGWVFERDKEGRIQAGQRGELGFEVREFFQKTTYVREVSFEHSLSHGRLKILAIDFNQPLKAGVFSQRFLETYAQKSWEEIEDILDDKN